MAVRREWRFFGHVQGVGFRYAALRLAERFAVAGWVHNAADGTVEVVAEGEADELEAWLDALMERLGAYVTEVRGQESPATGEFRDFSVRR